MLGNWIKTFVLMAGITALFGAVGIAARRPKWHVISTLICRRHECLCVLVFR